MYFWAYENHPAVAKKLAVLWWLKANKAGTYAAVQDRSCVVLYVGIDVPDDAYLDCNDPVFEDRLYEALSVALDGLADDKALDQSVMHKLYEYLIEQIEIATGQSIDVIRARVAPPGGSFKEKIVVGHPNCYVVRKRCDRIELAKSELVDVPLVV